MPRFKDLTGKKFGKLTILSNSGKKDKRNYVIWNCLCECGATKEVASHTLNKGSTHSCGCLRKQAYHKGIYGESLARNAYNKTKNGAKVRGYIFEITFEEFKLIASQKCFYCGSEASNKCSAKGYYGVYRYNGLDRMNSDFGYTISNVVPCCKTCNKGKWRMSVKEFKEWIGRVYLWLNLA